MKRLEPRASCIKESYSNHLTFTIYFLQVIAILRDAIDNESLSESDLLSSPVLTNLGLHIPERRLSSPSGGSGSSGQDVQIAALASWSTPALMLTAETESRKRKHPPPKSLDLDAHSPVAAKRALLRDVSEDTSFRRSTLEDDSSEEDEFPATHSIQVMPIAVWGVTRCHVE